MGDRNLKTINAVKTLKNALHNRKYPARELIHHSDRGYSMVTHHIIAVLESNGINISMATKYDPSENAIAERGNGILKTEYEIGEGFGVIRMLQKRLCYMVYKHRQALFKLQNDGSSRGV